MKLHLDRTEHIFIRKSVHIKCVLFCAFLFLNYYSFSQQVKNEADLKKQADKFFEDEEYNQAYKLYAQLVSNYPKDPEYNYRLGVCMLFTEPDKKKPFSYLKIATNNPKDAPKDAKFYLAKTYHINYQFDEAIKLYNEYKLIGSSSSIKKLQVDREIEACKNGKRLLSNISDLVVLNKKTLNEADYFRSYDISGIGGKLLVKPDDFKTSADKKKKEKSVMYLPKTGDKVFYSSYGENGETGRDIYVKTKTAGGFSAPQLLPSVINTEYDEDYPFLHPNGKTLYFSSKGHNSMGGYDVFKTTFDDKTKTWTKPVNLEFPISSPDDDILFVTDSLEKKAYFSTGRYSPYGKIDVLKINIERQPINFAYLKGTVVKEDVAQSVKSKITVKNLANNEIVGVFDAGDNGDYKMELPNGGKFAFTVETPGIETQTQNVNIPVASNLKPYKQMISYDKKILRITNYFDGNADDGYELIRDLIEKKAKLEMWDAASIATANSKSNSSSLNSVSSGNPTATDGQNQASNGSATNSQTTDKSMSNEQLLEIAKNDAKEAEQEATKLKQEAEDAFGLATQKNTEAQNLKTEADALLTSANTMADGSAKKETLQKANTKKDEAKIAADISNTASELAKKLNIDANNQKQEADLTNQYVKEIESVIKNKNNKEALGKLQQIQNQLNELAKQKNQSDELLAALKAEGELKQNELKKLEKKQENAKNTLTAIGNETKELEKDLANETDNEVKDNIKAQIRELNTELDTKTKELASNTEKYNALKTEVDGINKEIEMTNAVLSGNTESIANNTNTEGNLPTKTNTVTDNTNNQQIVSSNTVSGGAYTLNFESITNNYKEQLNKKPTTKEDITTQNNALKMYNSDIVDLIALNKDERFTANDKDKKKLTDEINKLEKQKASNDKLIAANNSKLKALDANNQETKGNEQLATNINNTTTNNKGQEVKGNEQIAANNKGQDVNSNSQLATNTNNPTTNTKGQDVNNNNQLATNNNQVSNPFEFSNYSSPNSNQQKESILKTYNAALENEAALKTQLANLEKNTTSANTESNTATELITQAENLNNEALVLRKQLATAKGSEKDNIQKQITEKEKNALDLKLKAADDQEKENQAQFELNKINIAELVKLSSKNPNNDVSQANMLIDEADINKKQSTNLREEANAYPIGSAKLGGLGNAEEKEAEALLKQQKAIELLLKQNPNYKLKVSDNVSNSSIADITKKLEENNQTKNNAFIELSKLNQSELKIQGEKLQSNAAFNSPNNKEVQNLKAQADVLKNEANDIVTNQLKATTDITEKQKLLLTANTKEVEALKLLEQANQKLAISTNKGQETNSNAQLANNNQTSNNQNQTANNKGQEINGNSQLANNNQPTNNQNQTFNNKGQDTNSNAQLANNNQTSNNQNSNNKEQETNSNAQLANNNKTSNNQNSNNKGQETNSNTQLANNNQPTNNQTSNNKGQETNNNTQLANNNTQLANNNQPSNNQNANNKEQETNNNTQVATNNQSTNNQNQTSNNKGQETTGNGVSDEANKLKTNLSNPTESSLTQFNSYTNNEAIDLKNKAYKTINEALEQDKSLSSKLDNVAVASNKTSTQNNNTANNSNETLSQQSINNLTLDAEKLNDQAFALRQSLASKSGEEKEKLINEAKELENKSVEKKIQAANKQEILNLANYNANESSLNELATLAKGKNITEMYVIEMQLTEAEIFMKQASTLRSEANAYPNNSAKLGGLNNAEEKEALALQKQEAALSNYKKYFANYQPVKPNLGNSNTESAQQLTSVKNEVNTNEQKHVDGLMQLADANKKEYNNRLVNLKNGLSVKENELKTKAQDAYKKSQGLFSQAEQEPIISKKKNLLVDAAKVGQEAISYLNGIINGQVSNNYQLANNQNQTNNNGQVVNNNQSNNKGQETNGSKTTNVNGANIQNTNGNGQLVNNNASQESNVNNNQANNNKTNNANNNQTSENNSTTNIASNNNNQGNNNNNQTNTPNNLTTNNKGQNSNNNSVSNNQTATTNTRVAVTNTSAAISNENTNGANLQNTNGNGQITQPNNNSTNNTSTSLSNQNQNKTVLKVKEQELSVKNNNAYSDAKPIPLDEKMPKGLYFKVQIGSFKQQIPNSTFKGLTPLSAQTANNGYIRYMAGNFAQFDDANALKNDLKQLGYTDAFVVAYFDGERIPLLDAPEKTSNNVEIKNNPNTSVGITTAANVPQNPFPTVTPEAAPVNELEKTNGLLHTIQVGIYSRPVAKGALYNLRPLYRETLPNGLYRYTAGIYNEIPKVLEDKTKVNNLGIKDAFASSYLNGKRIAFDEGRKMQTENSNVKMEAQNPIVFDGQVTRGNQTTNNTSPTLQLSNSPTNTVQPFSNGVTNAPTPTADNGVKADDAGISYKVQVGAYRNQVPADVANKFMSIKTWPVNNLPINGLFIYTIGNFTSSTFAKKLKDEAVSLGLTDAFVTVYKDGKKLYGAEASELLNK